MKQFFAALAANFVTIAILVVGFFVILIGIVATIGQSAPAEVPQGAVLVIDLDRQLADAPAESMRRSTFDDALSGGDEGVPIRSALLAVRTAATDNRVSGILIRGRVSGTGYAALRELRAAIADFRATSRKPVHAFLVDPETRDYYVASAANTITLDPFGSLLMPGISAEAVFLSGFLEKYGIGVQVTRVGRFKAAVEPLTRTSMSPENREQTERYVGALWSEVKQAISESRGIDTIALQQLVDAQGIILPDAAKAAGLVDRVAYWDVVLTDLRELTAAARGTNERQVASGSRGSRDTSARARPLAESAAAVAQLSSDSTVVGPTSRDTGTVARTEDSTRLSKPGGAPRLPQVQLADYAVIANNKNRSIGADQKVAIVYASGDIVDGEGGAGLIGGDALARDLRRIRTDDNVKAVVLRVNSPGGSAVASETMQRELTLIAADKPVVVSMGSVAASGGYWIATAATQIFAQPNTITGSIGVFGLIPNLQRIANRHGITFDTVKTGRYADIFSVTRPRTNQELAVIQLSVDAIYEAFITRVATARNLPPDSVRVIAEGRVWSGEDAVRIGLVDSVGGLDAAIRSAASLAKLTGEYALDEYPRRKGTAELLSEMFERRPPPVAGQVLAESVKNDRVRTLAKDILGELESVLAFNDPRNSYARMAFILNVR